LLPDMFATTSSVKNTTYKSIPRGEQKRIILLCDGTGNSASRRDERSTNVKRLLDLISPTFVGEKSLCQQPLHPKDPTLKRCRECGTQEFIGQQVVYYQSGVGTSKDMSDWSVTF